jgi:hypothetical protein
MREGTPEATLMLRSKVWASLFLVLWFSTNSALAAAENPRALDIQVLSNGFGNVSSVEIAAVLQSAASQIWRYCPQTQLSGTDVYHRNDHPQTDYQRTPGGRIQIGLTAQGTHWAQFAFQFGHEFCHALANYANNLRRFVRYSPQSNFWLEESLCETASLFTLRRMTRSWCIEPPYPSWRPYAQSLEAYADQRLALPEHQIDKPFRIWFAANEPVLRHNPTIRDWNTIIAIHLLPVFEAEPHGWKAVSFLNSGSHDINESLAKRLTEWRSRCPPNLRSFVAKLGAVFGR